MKAFLDPSWLLLLGVFLMATPKLNAQACEADFDQHTNGLSVGFVDQSEHTTGDPIIAWFWEFGDGNTSNLQHPTHTYAAAGSLEVCLRITTANGCSSTTCDEVDFCELDLQINVGNCTVDNQVALTITITDVYDEAKFVDIFVDGQRLPEGPFEIEFLLPVQAIVFVPGDGLEHSIGVQSTKFLSCQSIAHVQVPSCNPGCFLAGLQVELKAGGIHEVQIQDNFFSPVNTTIELGDQVLFNWLGTNDHSTTSDAVSGIDSWNSGERGFGASFAVDVRNPGLHPYYCIPHGDPGGVGMSGQIIANCPADNRFSLDIGFNVVNPPSTGYDLFIDGIRQNGSPFPYEGSGAQNLTAELPGDGLVHLISIIDVGDPTCMISQEFLSPDCGAVPLCQLSISASEVEGCNALGKVMISLEVNAINPVASTFQVLLDGVPSTSGPYFYGQGGVTTLSFSLPGDGLAHRIEVVDSQDDQCRASTVLQTTNCSIPCQLSGLVLSAGEAVIHQVEVQDFAFSPSQIEIKTGDQVEWHWTGSVAHTSTSDATTGPDSWDSGLLGQGNRFRSPALSAGVHRYYCIPHGGPGGLGMSGLISVQPDCTEGVVSVTASFTAQAGSAAGFGVKVDGIETASHTYTEPTGINTIAIAVVGDGQTHQIEIYDKEDLQCKLGGSILTPDCSASSCHLEVSAVEVGDCQAGQVVSVQVEVNSIGSGSQFQLWIDDNLEGLYNYANGNISQVQVQLPGDGLAHRIEVVDSQDDQCRASTVLQTTNCSIPCQLSGLVLSAGEAVIHQVEVQDFAFSPSQIEIKTGDQVEWHWTGSVAHTSTSDATTGPDSWDSGLLGQGNRFRSPALSAGVHRYYCIPHGGPGGLGMSGLISVQPDCTEGVVSVTASFTAQAGSAAGFGVKVDGIETASHTYTEPTGINTIAIAVVGDGQTHQIEIFDIDQPACTVFDSIKVENCEVPTCFIEITDIQEGSCTANGLRIYTISLTSSEERSEGFKVSIDGQVQEDTIYSYATTGLTNLTLELPGDEQMHQISVQDISSLSCTDTITLSSSSCGETCSIYLNAVQLSGCTSDSLIPYELQVHVNPSQQRLFRLQIDGQVVYDTTLAPMGQDTVALPVVLPGDGKTHVIHLSQVGSENCEDSVVVSTLNCGISCSITGLSFEIGSRKEQEIQVLDFEFHPKEVSIEQGDLVRFNWIGSIPHTSTSDATGGPDGWNSGLLGQGSSFEVSISELGDHPYYCIPHGSPGGIGMAGLIQVEDPCADLALAVRTQFTAVNGNLSGYVVSIDDQVLGTTPFLYSESGQETVSWNMEAQGNSFQIGIYDVEDPGCRIDTILTMPNCTDPCFGFSASFFEYAIDVSNYTVDFTIEEKEADRWYWTFGNGVESTAQNPSIIYEQPGIYEVCLTSEQATTGCSAIWCQVLEIRAVVCEAAFELEQEGLSLKLQNQSVSTSPLETMVWTFGEASIATGEDQLEYTFDTLGQYPVCLAISTAECQSDTCITVNLSDPCLILEPNFSYIHSSEGLGIQFEDVSQGNVNQWLWGFGNGFTANEQHPIHAYERAGTYKVCLLVQDTLAQCSAAYCEEILVGTTSRQTVPSLNRKLTIYPNPISVSRLQWTVSGLQQEDLNQRLVVKLYDLRGKTLYQGQVQGQEEILFSIEGLVALSTGIYFLELKNGPVIYHGKIIIQ